MTQHRRHSWELAFACSLFVGCVSDSGRLSSSSLGNSIGSESATDTSTADTSNDTSMGDGDGDGDGTSMGDSNGTTMGDGDGDGDGDSIQCGEVVAPGTDLPCSADFGCTEAPCVLGGMSGDKGSDEFYVHGNDERWVEFRITEDDVSALNGAGMSFIAQLTSPPGENFDLTAARSVAPNSDPCAGTITQTSQNLVGIDQVAMYWGESSGPNGEDDTREISLHIVPMSDACSSDRAWVLTVTRN